MMQKNPKPKLESNHGILNLGALRTGDPSVKTWMRMMLVLGIRFVDSEYQNIVRVSASSVGEELYIMQPPSVEFIIDYRLILC